MVIRDFQIRFGEEAVAAVLSAGLRRPALRRRAAAVVEEAEAIVAPAACLVSYPIEGILHRRLQLRGGGRIGCGELGALVAGAEALYLAVCTLGPLLDERIRAHRDRGRYLEMVLLDELGTWAVDQLRAQLLERIQAEAADRGWRVSSPLSPGESAWPLREQRIVFRLLDPSRIGVTLGPGDLMRPLKTLSLALGAGSEMLGPAGLDRCRACSIRDRCRYAVA